MKVRKDVSTALNMTRALIPLKKNCHPERSRRISEKSRRPEGRSAPIHCGPFVAVPPRHPHPRALRFLRKKKTAHLQSMQSPLS